VLCGMSIANEPAGAPAADLAYGNEEDVVGGIEIIDDRLPGRVAAPGTAALNSLDSVRGEAGEDRDPLERILRLGDLGTRHDRPRFDKRAQNKTKRRCHTLYEGALLAKDGSLIPVLMSVSVLSDNTGREVGMVGFATDLRARKREEEELEKARDELEKRVEERTAELKTARERLRYLMTVTPAIVYTNQASDYTCTFVSENVSRIMEFSAWEMLEDRFLVRASSS